MSERTREEWKTIALELRAELRRLEAQLDAVEEETLDSVQYAGQYRDLFKHSVNGLALHEVVLDDHERAVDAILLAVNRAFEEATGLRARDVVGRRVTEIFENAAELGLLERYSEVTETGEAVRFEQFVPQLDRHLDISAYSPAPGFLAVSLVDITEKHRARNEELRELNRELERSNRDLEEFAYVASHDLQEPLRTITGFIQLLEQRYADSFDDQGQQYLQLVVDGAAHMNDLIHGLLEYSRVQTHGKPPAVVDCATAVRRAIDVTRASFQESSILVAWDDLPTLLADEIQVVQLFQNLLSNAIRFRSDQPPEVHIGAEREGGFWALSVRDNGIGIEPQYAERIFKIFERLHRRDEVPGTGIGLAICARIVQRHGGEIRVDSSPGEGSTFTFTLPAAD